MRNKKNLKTFLLKKASYLELCYFMFTEEAERKAREAEERRLEEEALMATMAEQERIEYERRKREEEAERIRKEEEEK